MTKMTVTIEGIDKKTMKYIVEKIRPTSQGLTLELGQLAPPPTPVSITREELVILTPFYEDHSLCSRPPWYRALTPQPKSKPGIISPRQYCFKAPFSLRQRLVDMQKEFGLDLRDRAIIFCVKRKGTENNWSGSIQRIETK